MYRESVQVTVAVFEIQSEFNTVFIRQLKQFLGSEQLPQTMPLNLATMACMILLAEREQEIEYAADNVPDRFCDETFNQALDDLGFPACLDTHTGLRQLIGTGALKIEPDGWYVAQLPILQTTQLLDHIFPAMPGLSLLAYAVQTIEEVASGRKELSFAIAQFEQTLLSQGSALTKAQETSSTSPSPATGKAKTGADRQPVTKPKGLSRQEAMKLLLSQAKRNRTGPTTKIKVEQASIWMPKALNGQGQPAVTQSPQTQSEQQTAAPSLAKEIKPVVEPQEAILQIQHDTSEPLAAAPHAEHVAQQAKDASGQDSHHSTPESTPPPVDLQKAPAGSPEQPQTEGLVNDISEGEQQPSETDADVISTTDVQTPAGIPVTPAYLATDARLPSSGSLPPADTHPAFTAERNAISEFAASPPPVTLSEPTAITDDDIEHRIHAFAQDLAMACPVCSLGKVTENKTAKGQTFYECSHPQCDFISWGKPIHQACPLCKNPFLVEADDGLASTGLQCPRGTCMYTTRHVRGKIETEDDLSDNMTSGEEPAPKRRKKVVRKRVVRRKRRS